MNTRKLFLIGIIFVTAFAGHGQGTFIYDQQSSDETANVESSPGPIQSTQPVGQSFTPGLSSVGFVRLALSDENSGNNLGATVFVNILANSINGTVLSSTAPVAMPDGFGGYATFYFPTPVSVTPGTTYYFQPIVMSGGDTWDIRASLKYNYTGGVAYSSGVAANNFDLWFREGLVVPEPSTWALLLVGGSVLFFHRRKSK